MSGIFESIIDNLVSLAAAAVLVVSAIRAYQTRNSGMMLAMIGLFTFTLLTISDRSTNVSVDTLPGVICLIILLTGFTMMLVNGVFAKSSGKKEFGHAP